LAKIGSRLLGELGPRPQRGDRDAALSFTERIQDGGDVAVVISRRWLG
jgi:hypothetical protein